MNSTLELTRASNGRTQVPTQEVEALWETLRATERRLAELTQPSPAANSAAIAGRDVQAVWLEDSHFETDPARSHLPAAILDALPANIALLNAAGVIVTVNGAWRRFAEENQFATPNHGVGLNYLDLCTQTQGAEAGEAHLVATGIRAVLQGTQKSFALEYACHSPTEERWFAMTVTPLTAGQVDGVVVMHRNITERKRTELRLLEVLVEGQRFRAALDQVSACIYMKDRESRYLYANRPTLELFGCSATELVGRPDADFFPPETVRRLREVDGRVLQGEATNEEIEAVHGPGDRRVYLEVKTPLYDESDPPRIIGLLGVSTDMTERRRSEREEERKQQRYLQQRNALINFAEATPGTAQLDDTLRRITETSAATLGVARVSVWRYNEDHSAIRCVDLFEAASGRHSSGPELAAADYPAYFRALAAQSVVVAADAQQHESTREFAEHYLRPLGISAMLDAPLHLGGQVAGVLCHEHVGPVRPWTTDEETFALAAANLVSNALEVAERKRAQAEREALHQQLVMASRQSGMAEIATNVLHNVGNVLNSVNISTSLITDTLKSSKLRRLGQLAELLRAHAGDLAEFFTCDPKGKQVPTYLLQLSDHLQQEHTGLLGELEALQRSVDHIKEIVATQQSYARFGGVKELVPVADLIEDALRLNQAALIRHGVEVRREFVARPVLNLEKHKVLQILVNLIRNAKLACRDADQPEKHLTIGVREEAGRIKITVTDNGVGIAPENLTRIFGHGFTTRKDGHGFGLHSGALAAQEMGGTLTAASAGLGQGACFTLELPGPTPEVAHA